MLQKNGMNDRREMQRLIDWIKKSDIDFGPGGAAEYKVKLFKGKDPSEYSFLDWDKPLSKQGEKVGKILKDAEQHQTPTNHFKKWIAVEYPSFAKDFEVLSSGQRTMIVEDYVRTTGKKSHVSFNLETGQDLYNKLETMKGSKEAASKFLNRAGIDGIRYPVGDVERDQKCIQEQLRYLRPQ